MTKCSVSHSTTDRPYVEREILGILGALGIDVWFAEDTIETTEHWERSIRKGLEASDWFVLVLSKQSAQSEWVKDEVNWAMSNLAQKIVPLIIEDCDPVDFHIRLPRIQHIDFRKDIASAREEMIRFFVDATFNPLRRGNVIDGTWTGTVNQEHGPTGKPIEYKITFNLKVRKEQIAGDMQVEVPSEIREDETDTQVEFVVTGGLLYDRFVQLTYKAKDPRVIQFGSSMFEIDDRGLKMSGPFIGYGSKSKRIISGFMKTKKNTE